MDQEDDEKRPSDGLTDLEFGHSATKGCGVDTGMLLWRTDTEVVVMEDGKEICFGDARTRHKLAALCLFEHLFGFEQRDVDDLRDTAELVRRDAPEMALRLEMVAENMSMLLPTPKRPFNRDPQK